MELLEGCAGWALILGLLLWLLLGWDVAWPLLAFFAMVVLVQVARHRPPTAAHPRTASETEDQREPDEADTPPNPRDEPDS